jgi:hypothetical protein
MELLDAFAVSLYHWAIPSSTTTTPEVLKKVPSPPGIASGATRTENPLVALVAVIVAFSVTDPGPRSIFDGLQKNDFVVTPRLRLNPVGPQ